jgi:hypothetical protein
MRSRGVIDHEQPDHHASRPPMGRDRMRPRHSSVLLPTTRRVARGGSLGALPGLLLAVVPLVLVDLGVLSADQAQIGFIGVPLLVIGTLAGVVAGAVDTGCTGTVLVGAGVGFVVGVAAGMLAGVGLHAVGAGFGGVWLVTTPLAMITGAALALRARLRHAQQRERS